MTASDAPIRDPRFAPRRLEIGRAADGAVVLTNPTPLLRVFPTTVAPLAHWAEAAPDRTWLAERSGEGWRRVSYAEGRDLVAALAGGLERLGLARQTPVLLLARNSVDTALVTYALMTLALPVAAVSPQYGLKGADLSRLAHAVRLLRPGALYVDDAEAFEDALGAPFVVGLPVIAGRNPRPGHLALAELLRSPAAPSIAEAEDIARLLLTSGSTGDPKAVMALHRTMAHNGAQLEACYVDPEPQVMITHAPWSHSMGANSILHMALHRGASLYLDAGQPAPGRFGETVRNLREIAPTYHSMVPAGWDLLAGELERDPALARSFFSRIRVMQYGGAGLGQATGDRIEALAVRTVGERIHFGSAFGATETGPAATNVHWPSTTLGVVGLPLPATTVKLAPVGDKLEARIKGPQVSPGYYRAPEATAAAFDEEGFYRLGDAVKPVDPDRLELGLRFDGRLVENFKLGSGVFVNAGALRITAVSAMGAAARDAVVCGEGEAAVGLLVFRNDDSGLDSAATREAVRTGLTRFNREAVSAGGRVGRALVVADQPDPGVGEITDKGYINQSRARSRRAGEIARLFAAAPDPDVIVLEA